MFPTLTPALASAMALFAFAASITPGPNNTMLMASGANFGLRASVPHLLGVQFGFMLLLFLCGIGLGGVFSAVPVLHVILKWGGAAYLLYLAWKIATAKGVGVGEARAHPTSFAQAVAFQFVNPKGWAMTLGAVATYVPAQGFLPNLALALLIFSAVGAPCSLAWTVFGLGLRQFLDRPRVLRPFNLGMAALLVASLYPLFAELAAG